MNPSRSITQRLVSGGTLAAVGKIIAAISALTLNALLTRLLTPDAVGAYYLLISVVTISALGAQLGVHQTIVRVLAGSLGENKSDVPRRAIRAAFLIVILGSTLISVPYALGGGQWLGSSLFDSSLISEMAVITAFWIAACAIQKLVSQIFRGFHYIGYATLFEGTSTALLLVIALVYIWLSGWQLALRDVVIITLGALLITISYALVSLRKPYMQLPSANGADVKGLLQISLPLFVASITVLGATEAHIWILGSIRSEDEVAIYGAAYRLAKLVVVPLIIINSIIPPMVAQFVAQGKTKDVERVLRATATVAGLPSIIVVIGIALGASEILSLLFGEFYEQGANILIIVMSAQALNALTGSPGVLLMMSGHQSIVMKIALVSGMMGFITSIVLVESLGGTGVALGVAVGLSAHNLGMWAYCWSKLNIRTHMGLVALKEILAIASTQIFRK